MVGKIDAAGRDGLVVDLHALGGGHALHEGGHVVAVGEAVAEEEDAQARGLGGETAGAKQGEHGEPAGAGCGHVRDSGR